MSGVTLSVVIPTHNREDLLRELLEALCHQTFPSDRFEVIVVIDGSTDGTYEMLQGIQTPYRLRVVPQPQSGVAAARNRGAREAQGDFLLFMDDDLLPDTRLLEEHVRSQAGCFGGVVLGRLVPNLSGKQTGWKVWEDRIMLKHYEAVADGRRPPAGRRLYSGNFSVPRQVFLELGGFNEGFRRGEDTELGMRLERSGVSFHYNGDASAVHRGIRSFASWCSSAYAYGRCEVVLARQAAQPQVMTEVFERYYHRPLPVRWMVRLSLGNGPVRRALTAAFRAAAGALSTARLYSAAHGGYTTIFNIQYWNGVADETGGVSPFLDHLRRVSERASTGATSAPGLERTSATTPADR